MENLVLHIFYFLRPISYIDIGWELGGIRVLELYAIIFFAVLLLLYAIHMGGKSHGLTSLDFVMYAFMFWCLAGYLIYFEKSQIRDLMKFILPFFTYIVLRMAIRDRDQFYSLLKWMLIGFVLPVVLTTVFILLRKGVYVQNYWTGIFRYTGVYPNPHDLGHNMAFLIMLVVVYLTLWKEHASPVVGSSAGISNATRLGLLLLTVFALFCLYKSYVRTAYLGLTIFGLSYLYFYSKKWFVIAIGSMLAAVVLLWSVWSLIFYDVVEVYEGKQDAERFASGRPYIWKHNWEIFSGMDLDRQLAGVGIGNRGFVLKAQRENDNIWNSHNDFLEVMIQTGYVGFLLYMLMQLLIFKAILRLEKRERYVFLSMFLAIIFMNFASNSYVSRFGLGQMLYMILVYIQLPGPEKVARVISGNDARPKDNTEGARLLRLAGSRGGRVRGSKH